MSLFGTKIKEEDVRQKSPKNNAFIKKHERQLEEYQKLLTRYDESVKLIETLLQEYDSKECNVQMDRVQTALDLKYLKEQGDQLQEQLQTLSSGHIAEIDHSMESMQSAMTQIVQQQEEIKELFEKVLTGSKSQKKINIFIMILVLVNLAGMVVSILNTFDWL